MEIKPFLSRFQQDVDIPVIPYDFDKILNAVRIIGTNLVRTKNTPEYLVDLHNRDSIDQLIYYFKNDKQFNGDLSKGLMIRGNVGTGKSILMRIFSEKTPGLNFTKTKNFKYFSALDVYGEFVRNGYPAIENHTRYSRRDDPNEEWMNSTLFDELGIESTAAKNFGNTVNVMELIIAKRYNNWQTYGQLTHFTTNLTPDEIEKNYGERVRSRLCEMCNDMVIVGSDRRRK
jgi:hypothetical protein